MPRKLSHTTYYAMVILITMFSCQEPAENLNEDIALKNTLTQNSVGSGKEGDISSYFYNLTNSVNATFYRFGTNNFNLGYKEYIELLGTEPPVLTFKNFPEYLVEITPDDGDYTQRSSIDSLPLDTVVYSGSITINSNRVSDISTIIWKSDGAVEDQRYEISTSTSSAQTETIDYTDTLVAISYQAVIDTPLISTGLMYVDHSEWEDTTYNYHSSEIPFTATFNYENYQLGSNLYIYRKNTDCNENQSWDDAGTAVSNGVWDPAEAYYDNNGISGYQLSDPFEDRNCNGVRDTAEWYGDYGLDGLPNTSDTLEGNGRYDFGEPFEDRIDTLAVGERYTDANNNGQPESDELYILTERPNNILVSWEDLNEPRILNRIEYGDSLVDRWGMVHNDIIVAVPIIDIQNRSIHNIDSTVTLYTNKIIEYDPRSTSSNYDVAKTEWIDNFNNRNYDYLLFKTDDNVYQLTHPTYFVPEGFDNEFWATNELVDEILFYTVNGKIRDGEVVEESYYDTTALAIYKIEKSFTVESDTVTEPAKAVKYFNTDSGTVCYRGDGNVVADPSECLAADTTFLDCFKITRTKTITLIGNGVEFGLKDITWLARGMGIVRDESLFRWTEEFGSEEMWVGSSKWELGHLSVTGNSGAGRFMARRAMKKLNELQALPAMDNDPYQINHVYGFQRVGNQEN